MDANELRDKTPDQLRDELVALEKGSFQPAFSAGDWPNGEHKPHASGPSWCCSC